MTKRPLKNLSASVRARLHNRARSSNEPFQQVLERYVLERFLYRLSISGHREAFVLKGAFLLTIWGGSVYRPSRDIDFQAQGANDLEQIASVVREVCVITDPEDGVVFAPATIEATRIREDEEYEGVRVRLEARVEQAVVRVQIDVGFGDAIHPAPTELVFPTMLDFPAPRLRGYPRETVVAQKFQAMVHLGRRNSRMKDFRDIWSLARNLEFSREPLATAIRATFSRRRTPMPGGIPLPISEEFAADPDLVQLWDAYRARAADTEELPPFAELIGFLRAFLMGPLTAIAASAGGGARWPAGGTWEGP